MFFTWIDINGTKKTVESDTFTDAVEVIEKQTDFCHEECTFVGMTSHIEEGTPFIKGKTYKEIEE